MSYNNIKLPLVVIFGRTNVGKSTLFNCLIEKPQAIVSKVEGTTRDSNLGVVNWRGHQFNFVDTGGIIDLKYLTDKVKKTNDIQVKVQQQASYYLGQADLVLFLVDNKTGLLPPDKQLALVLKKIVQVNKIILVANKVDSLKEQPKTAEFYKLGLGAPIAVSAANGSGTGDLLDIVVKNLAPFSSFLTLDSNETSVSRGVNDEVKVCIIGKPNVGKSSLLNSILGYTSPQHRFRERVIVSPQPYTTREPQDSKIIYENHLINIIDTAGISKKPAYAPSLEKAGMVKSLAALARSDLALLVLDISQAITLGDAKLVAEIIKRKKSLIIIANKWDIIKDRQTKKYTNYIYAELPFVQFAPIQFISALTGEKVKKILELVIKIKQQRQLQLDQLELDKFLARILKRHRPARGKGTKQIKIYELKQLAANPPQFDLRIGARDDLATSYLRFIENRLRQDYGFLGTPITIKIVKKRL